MSEIRHRRNSDEPAEPELEPATHGVVLSPTGIVMGVPHALGVGPARPEPPDRWTLGPQAPSEAHPGGWAADDTHPVTTHPVTTDPVTTEPVEATVMRGAGVTKRGPRTRSEGRWPRSVARESPNADRWAG